MGIRTPRQVGGGYRRREIFSATGQTSWGRRAKIHHGGGAGGAGMGQRAASRMPSPTGPVTLYGDWKLATAFFAGAQVRIQAALDAGQARACLLLVREIKDGIKRGHPTGGEPFAPLHWFTIQQKGGKETPLIETGQLFNSIKFKKVGFQAWFVGIFKGESHHSGFQTVELAQILEEGALIPVTVSMWTYLQEHGWHLSPNTPYIHIPARPFLSPPIQDEEVQKRMVREISHALLASLTRTGGRIV